MSGGYVSSVSSSIKSFFYDRDGMQFLHIRSSNTPSVKQFSATRTKEMEINIFGSHVGCLLPIRNTLFQQGNCITTSVWHDATSPLILQSQRVIQQSPQHQNIDTYKQYSKICFRVSFCLSLSSVSLSAVVFSCFKRHR